MARRNKEIEKQKFHHGNLKEAAAKLAYDYVKTEGFAALNLRKIASDCGVDHSALYRHYKNKSSLVTSVILQGFKEMNASQIKSKSPEDYMLNYLDFAFKSPNIYMLLFSEQGKQHFSDPQIASQIQLLIKQAAKSFANTTDEIKIDDDLRDAVMRAWAFMHGFIDLWQKGLFKAKSDKLAKKYIAQQILYYITHTS